MRFNRVALVIMLLAAVGCGGGGAKDAETLAVESAEAWLEQVDGGSYGESWQTASELFKSVVTQDGWEQAIAGVRSPLGAVKHRRLQSKAYATSLPGAPEGEYVVIQYATDFENQLGVVETVTPMKDSDGKWRVSGYYVK